MQQLIKAEAITGLFQQVRSVKAPIRSLHLMEMFMYFYADQLATMRVFSRSPEMNNGRLNAESSFQLFISAQRQVLIFLSLDSKEKTQTRVNLLWQRRRRVCGSQVEKNPTVAC